VARPRSWWCGEQNRRGRGWGGRGWCEGAHQVVDLGGEPEGGRLRAAMSRPPTPHCACVALAAGVPLSLRHRARDATRGLAQRRRHVPASNAPPCQRRESATLPGALRSAAGRQTWEDGRRTRDIGIKGRVIASASLRPGSPITYGKYFNCFRDKWSKQGMKGPRKLDFGIKGRASPRPSRRFTRQTWDDPRWTRNLDEGPTEI